VRNAFGANRPSSERSSQPRAAEAQLDESGTGDVTVAWRPHVNVRCKKRSNNSKQEGQHPPTGQRAANIRLSFL